MTIINHKQTIYAIILHFHVGPKICRNDYDKPLCIASTKFVSTVCQSRLMSINTKFPYYPLTLLSFLLIVLFLHSFHSINQFWVNSCYISLPCMPAVSKNRFLSINKKFLYYQSKQFSFLLIYCLTHVPEHHSIFSEVMAYIVLLISVQMVDL